MSLQQIVQKYIANDITVILRYESHNHYSISIDSNYDDDCVVFGYYSKDSAIKAFFLLKAATSDGLMY